MAAISGSNPMTSNTPAIDSPELRSLKFTGIKLNYPWRWRVSGGRMSLRHVYAAPESLSEKVVESIKNAEETCSDDPASGECAAAWDEVEELSAAASHARDRKKDADPLEEFCKDNMETEECRTYED